MISIWTSDNSLLSLEHITFSSVMSELLQNTTEMEWDESENRTSSNFVTLEFSTEAQC